MNPLANPRFDELSRKAATGALSAGEREWLEAQLREQPARRAELEWDQALHDRLEEKVDAMAPMPGWERTERALLAEGEGDVAVRRAAAATPRSPGILDRLSDWFAATLGLGFNAQAVAAALVVVQAGAIALLAWQYPREDEFGQTRAATPDATPRGPLLRVSFRADMREADLRRALADVGGEIVGGPGQIGVYLVRVQTGALEAAAQRLRAGGTTELVEVVAPGR